MTPPDTRASLPPPWPVDAAVLAAWEAARPAVTVERRRDGVRLPGRIRFLVPADLEALHALHRAVLAALPDPGVFRADSRAFMERHLVREGRTVGTFLGSTLVGYAVVRYPLEADDSLGPEAGVPAAERARVAHYDGAAVHPAYRGNHLHRAMNGIRGRHAGLAGFHHLTGTVSPLNPYSLRNHLLAGFRVVAYSHKYGGHERLIIHRDFRARPRPADTARAHPCPLADTAAQRALLADGWLGFATAQAADGTDYVWYLPRDAFRAEAVHGTGRELAEEAFPPLGPPA